MKMAPLSLSSEHQKWGKAPAKQPSQLLKETEFKAQTSEGNVKGRSLTSCWRRRRWIISTVRRYLGQVRTGILSGQQVTSDLSRSWRAGSDPSSSRVQLCWWRERWNKLSKLTRCCSSRSKPDQISGEISGRTSGPPVSSAPAWWCNTCAHFCMEWNCVLFFHDT